MEASETEIEQLKLKPKKLKHAELVHTKWENWRNRKRFEDGKIREEVINTTEGLRTLSIVSLNPDNFISTDTRKKHYTAT